MSDSKTVDYGFIFSQGVGRADSRKYCSFDFVKLSNHFVPFLIQMVKYIHHDDILLYRSRIREGRYEYQSMNGLVWRPCRRVHCPLC